MVILFSQCTRHFKNRNVVLEKQVLVTKIIIEIFGLVPCNILGNSKNSELCWAFIFIKMPKGLNFYIFAFLFPLRTFSYWKRSIWFQVVKFKSFGPVLITDKFVHQELFVTWLLFSELALVKNSLFLSSLCSKTFKSCPSGGNLVHNRQHLTIFPKNA